MFIFFNLLYIFKTKGSWHFWWVDNAKSNISWKILIVFWNNIEEFVKKSFTFSSFKEGNYSDGYNIADVFQ